MGLWPLRDLAADEERAVAAFMDRVAQLPPPIETPAPSADLLVLKARLLRRWEAERRIQTPLDIAEPFQVAAGLAAAVLLLLWSMPSLLRVLPGLNV